MKTLAWHFLSASFFFFFIEKRRSKSPHGGNETMTAEGEPCDHHLDCLPGQDQLGRIISPNMRCLKYSPGFKTCILISTTDRKWYAREGQRLSRHVVGPDDVCTMELSWVPVALQVRGYLSCADPWSCVAGSCCDLREHLCKPHNRGLNNKCYDDCMCTEGESSSLLPVSV